MPGTRVIEYDMAGEKLATVDPTGARTQATYDDLGRQITATQIERKPASAAYTTRREYDDAGRLIKQIVPGQGTTTKTTSYEVNAAGETTKVTDPAGTSTMTYDLAGSLTQATDPNRNASIAAYDLAGRKTTAKDVHLKTDGTIETELRTYGYDYDLVGNPTSATSPEGHVTRQTFDALNRLTSLVEPVSDSESITTSFGYDATGARTRITDGRGNATWTGYNSLGLAEKVIEPATSQHPDEADRTWTHIYDAAGHPTATIQPGGVRIDRTFDDLGRLTKESGAGGAAATAERTYGHDLAGRRTTAGDLTIDYNDRGLPLKVSRGTVQQTAYTYDGLGVPLQRIDAAGTATFTYDSANRLKTATDPVTSRTLTYGYDPASRLKTITATSGTASTQTIEYDDVDRVTSQTLKNGSGTQLAKIAYGWDKDDNLTTKTTTGSAGAGTNTYTYDHAGRLTSWTAPGGAVTSYEWDASGNRTKAGTAKFTYDERNRLTSGDGTDYTYSPRGTLATSTKADATTNYTFDAFDRLIADGDSLYSYDALDRMTGRIRGTANQTFAYSGLGNDLATITDSGGTVQAKYARDLGGGLLGLKEGMSAAVAALSDLHGDLVATFTTTLQTSTAYDPFGTITAQTGTKTGLGYQGEYTDPDTGKVNMHARWYQPGTGTFTSRDTATLNPSPSVQANRYTYANASPLTGTDPTGHATITIGGGSLVGSGYGSSGSSGYTLPAGGYSSSGSTGGGKVIGRVGGGSVDDTCVRMGFCVGAGDVVVDPSWARMIELENEKKFWLGQDEVERLGLEVMPNGRPVDQPNFWFASEKVQNDYMAAWSPTMTDDQLAYSWMSVGGLESFAAMERAARKNVNDVRLGEWRKMRQVRSQLGSGAYALDKTGKPQNGSAESRYKYYNIYRHLEQFSGEIKAAAKKWGVPKEVLAAVLIYEFVRVETIGVSIAMLHPYGGPERVKQILGVNRTRSYGLAQLEPYKVQKAMEHFKLGNPGVEAIVDKLLTPKGSFDYAAMYLRYLKDTIKVRSTADGGGYYERSISWEEAGVAYCGCSGVTENSEGKWTTVAFTDWMLVTRCEARERKRL
jgi:RHS repeat-associated protein